MGCPSCTQCVLQHIDRLSKAASLCPRSHQITILCWVSQNGARGETNGTNGTRSNSTHDSADATLTFDSTESRPTRATIRKMRQRAGSANGASVIGINGASQNGDAQAGRADVTMDKFVGEFADGLGDTFGESLKGAIGKAAAALNPRAASANSRLALRASSDAAVSTVDQAAAALGGLPGASTVAPGSPQPDGADSAGVDPRPVLRGGALQTLETDIDDHLSAEDWSGPDPQEADRALLRRILELCIKVSAHKRGLTPNACCV